MSETLDYIWLGNPVSRWLIAIGIFLAVIVVLWPIKRWIVRRMKAIAAKTQTPYDNLVVEVFKSTQFIFIALIGLWAGSRALTLPDWIVTGLEKVAVLVVVLQVGLWATRALTEWLGIVARKRSGDEQTLTWLGGVD